MHIVTVTCSLDKNQMLIQAESIQKFVVCCTHHVVINDDSDVEEWRKLLTPYYINHTLKLYHFDRYNSTGWNTQQAYKLLMSHYVKDDYLILDTKNFFIKPVTRFDNIGDGSVININSKKEFVNANKLYSKKLNKKELTTVFNMGTPFMFKYVPIDIELIDWFHDQTEATNSEFVFYSYFVEPVRTKKYSVTWYENMIGNVFISLLLWWYRINPNIKMFGAHRRFVAGYKNINKLNSFLRKLEFSNQL